jgi:hypothetical protein
MKPLSQDRRSPPPDLNTDLTRWIQEDWENYETRNHITTPSLMPLVIKSRRMDQRGHAVCKPEVRNENKFLVEIKKTKLRGLSPQANYTDRATAACRPS